MSENISVEGEIDAGFSSYYDPEEHGNMAQTVAGTTEDDLNDELTEVLPGDVEPEDLTDKQRTVLEEAVSNPYQSATAIDEKIGSTQYANKILKQKAPEFYENIFKPRSSGVRTKQPDETDNKSDTIEDTDEPMSEPQTDLETVLDAIEATAQTEETKQAISHIREVMK